MIKAKIEIYVVRGGEFSVTPSVGELRIGEDCFFVKYYLEGDECVLEVRGGTIRQRRSGNISIDMTFREGEMTECRLEEGGRTFVGPVFTRVLGYSLTDDGCTVTLDYTLGEEGETTEMVFSAKALGSTGL